MINVINYIINNNEPFESELMIKLKDDKVNEQQYEFLKDRLNNYIININPKYSIKSKTKYYKKTMTLLMLIIIVMPDIILKDTNNTKMLEKHIPEFEKFYSDLKQQFI